ncbi:MAG: hypothetical protein ACRC8M_01505 [Cetobacterium sp.]|uniref:hypothetical protein n=1 Tax=Cetobacterium sp. TaxID=2071632 RepID=UPI003F362BF7
MRPLILNDLLDGVNQYNNLNTDDRFELKDGEIIISKGYISDLNNGILIDSSGVELKKNWDNRLIAKRIERKNFNKSLSFEVNDKKITDIQIVNRVDSLIEEDKSVDLTLLGLNELSTSQFEPTNLLILDFSEFINYFEVYIDNFYKIGIYARDISSQGLEVDLDQYLGTDGLKLKILRSTGNTFKVWIVKTKEVPINVGKRLSVRVHDYNPSWPIDKIYNYNVVSIKNNSLSKGNTDILLSNPLVAGTVGSPNGRIRVYSDSTSNTVPLMGYLSENDIIMTSIGNNNQYLSGTVTGKYIPIVPSQVGGNSVEITINNGGNDFKKTVSLSPEISGNPNGMMSTIYSGVNNGIEVGVDYQQSDRSKYGTDISLTSWDLEKKDIKIVMKHPLIENTFNISVPAFDGEVYYNKDILQPGTVNIDYTNKSLGGGFSRTVSGEISTSFGIGIKDYDLRILGTDNGKINLNIRLPKQINLVVKDEQGYEQKLPFSVDVSKISSGILTSDANYYYIHAPNDGWRDSDSSIFATVTLKTMFKKINTKVTISGDNLNLVSIGAKSTKGVEKRTTIINKIDALMTFKNFDEIIDVSSSTIGKSVSTVQVFKGIIQNENKIVLKGEDGITKIFSTTFKDLKTTPQQIEAAGVRIKYDELTDKFEFIKDKYVSSDKKLYLEIKTSKDQLIYVINLQLKNSSLETDTTIKFDSKNFNMIQGDSSAPYGRIRVYQSSDSNYNSKIGIIDSSDKIVVDINKKNGQFLQANITGNTYSLQPHHFGKPINITVGTNHKTINILSDLNGNPIQTQDFGLQDGIRTYVDYQKLSISNGAIDFTFSEWDGKSKTIPIKVEYSDGAVSNYTISIPEFEGKNYYNENLPLANEYLPTKKYTKEINEFMSGELDRIKLGTKDFDLRILGKNNISQSNLRIKIPQKIKLEAIDKNNTKQELEFAITLDGIQNAAPSMDGNYYIVSSTNDGYKDIISAMQFDIVLTGILKDNFVLSNLVTLKGKNLNLVSIGVENTTTSNINKMTTLIDEVEYRINFKNSLEVIDFRDKNKGEIILGDTQFEALDSNKIILKDSGNIILSKTISELKKGVELPDTGVKITYDSVKRNLKYEKVGYKDYSNENLTLEVRSEGNLLIRVITLKLYNKIGFEILPDKGTLDFGHFMPGDFKRAESLIEFKNPSGAKISVDLNPANNKNMYRAGLEITSNRTIPLSNIQIKDLKKGINNTNSFKISGEAKTTKNTEAGDYKGELDVIITIIP